MKNAAELPSFRCGKLACAGSLWRSYFKTQASHYSAPGIRLGSWRTELSTRRRVGRSDVTPRKQVMIRFLQIVLIVLALPPFQLAPAQAAEPADLLLVLASDVSRSVDHPKFILQREGYAAA